MHLGFLYSGRECVCTTVAVDKATKGRSGVIVPCLRFCCLACVGGAVNRGTIRKAYHIEGSFSDDCMLWCCCGPCAACQEYREVNRRYFANSD